MQIRRAVGNAYRSEDRRDLRFEMVGYFIAGSDDFGKPDNAADKECRVCRKCKDEDHGQRAEKQDVGKTDSIK